MIDFDPSTARTGTSSKDSIPPNLFNHYIQYQANPPVALGSTGGPAPKPKPLFFLLGRMVRK